MHHLSSRSVGLVFVDFEIENLQTFDRANLYLANRSVNKILIDKVVTGLSIAGVREFYLQQRGHLLRKFCCNMKVVHATLLRRGTRRHTRGDPESTEDLLHLVGKVGGCCHYPEVVASVLPMTFASPQPTNRLPPNPLR